MPAGASARPADGSRATGKEPEPIWPSNSTTSTVKRGATAAATLGCNACAIERIASAGRVSMRSVGKSCASRSGRR